VTYTPSAGDFLNGIFDGTNEVKWVVEAKQTDSPETGPYVSRAQTLTKIQGCPTLAASISNLDGQLNQVPGTPTVFAGVDVQENGNPVPDLNKTDFSVVEDGQSIGSFQFNQPSQSGARLADIVFIVDNSGSMGGEQNDVKSNIRSFVDALIANNVDFALGLTRYGQSANGGRPIIENNGVLIQDADQFKNSILTRNRTSGGREPGYHAIVQSASQFAFRQGSKKIFVIATDESPNQGFSSQGDALNALTNSDISLYASTRSFLNSRFQSLTDATGGQIFGIRENFSSVASSITSQVSSTYIVSYSSPTPFLGGSGVSREVTVSVSGQSCAVTASGTYTPGNVPFVIPTPSALDLSNQAQPNSSGLTISAEVSTFSGPDIQDVTLFYRTSSSNSSYSSVLMQPTSGSSSSGTSGFAKAAPTYEATIPSSNVQSPGVDYYITASDGQSTVSFPSADPQSNPLQVAVLPNEPPQIAHSAPEGVVPGNPVLIGADVVDNTDALSGVKLFYRRQGLLTYTEVAMNNPSADLFKALIPGSHVTNSGVEYYIKATDNRGVSNTEGTADNPISIAPAEPCPSALQISDFDADQGGDPDTGEFVEITNSSSDEPASLDECALVFFDGANSSSYYATSLTGVLTPAGTHRIGNPGVEGADQTLANGTLQDGPDAIALYKAPASDFPNGTVAGANLDKRHSAVVYVSDDYIFGCYNATVPGCGKAGGQPVLTRLDELIEQQQVPDQFALEHNYPNPFSGQTTIRYALPEKANVELVIYDVLGREVRRLVDESNRAGQHEVTWDGRSASGQPLASGVYFYRLKAADFVETKSVHLVR